MCVLGTCAAVTTPLAAAAPDASLMSDDGKDGGKFEGKAGDSDESSGEEADFHIFVMEDTDFDLECMVMMAEESGFECTGFGDWRAAEAALDHPDCPADLIVCDYNQPEFDTLGFFRKMKQKGIKVVAMSGDSDREMVSDCLDGGLAAAFMVKPVTFEDVQALDRFNE